MLGRCWTQFVALLWTTLFHEISLASGQLPDCEVCFNVYTIQFVLGLVAPVSGQDVRPVLGGNR